MCKSCPFSGSYEAEEGINLGCLPSVYEIFQLKREQDVNWTCHYDEKKPCAGYVETAKDYNIDITTGTNVTYKEWYHGG